MKREHWTYGTLLSEGGFRSKRRRIVGDILRGVVIALGTVALAWLLGGLG